MRVVVTFENGNRVEFTGAQAFDISRWHMDVTQAGTRNCGRWVPLWWGEVVRVDVRDPIPEHWLHCMCAPDPSGCAK